MPQTYVYPTRKTATAQDLMTIITRSCEERLLQSTHVLPQKTGMQKLFLETPFIFVGLGLSYLLRLAPARPVLDFQAWVFSKLASPNYYPFDPASPILRDAAALAARLAKETGREPALMALISHPPVMGEMAHLNFELVRHAVRALWVLRGRECRPRLVVAVDPFALDGISSLEEGFYAGFMGRYHLGLDRLALLRNPFMRLLLRHTAWDRMPQRLTACLGAGGEVGMVLSGGVPATGRVLYALREWAGRQRALSPLRSRPLELLRRLRESPDFLHFEKYGPHGAGLRSVWRLSEGWLMAAVAGVFGGDAQNSRGALNRYLEALEFSPEQKNKALADLDEEMARQTPYRTRLFKIIARRVLARARPVVFLPIVHQALGSNFGIELKPAWAWRGYHEGQVNALISSGQDRQPSDWKAGPEEFARRFVKENFA